jgi:hypothetical protein
MAGVPNLRVVGLALVASLVAVAGAHAATPPVTAGLQLWYDASQEAYVNGAPVTQWSDRSGHGRDLTPGIPSMAPTMRRSAVNGRPAIEFDGVADELKTYGSSFTLGQPTTFFIVYRSLDPNNDVRAFVFDSSNSLLRQAFGRPGASQIRMYANFDLDFGGITYPFPGYSIFSGTFNGTSSSLYRDGAPVGAGNAGDSTADGFTVGGLSTSDIYGYDYSHSLVAEILYYSGALSASDRLSITKYLNSKYAIVTSPPSNTSSPTISGPAQVGATLTADPGTWTGKGVTFSYQWFRCGLLFCTGISGETAQTHVLTSGDAGSRMLVQVTGTNLAGSNIALSPKTSTVSR